jgi:hypothetical protein
MRLVRRLINVLVAAAVAGGALGGAAALGSTLFENPPRDAAEFAQWVEAGSTQADADADRAKPAARGPTPAERRYVRRLNAMCARQEREAEALRHPRTRREMLEYIERSLPMARRHHEEFRRLDPPRSYRDESARLLALDRSGLRTIEAMRSAFLRRDRGAYEASVAKLNLLVIRLDRIFRRMRADSCLSD